MKAPGGSASVVVDCHAHFIPGGLIDVLRGGHFPGIEVRITAEELRFAFPGLAMSPPAPARISRLAGFASWLDANGIDVQILSPWTDLLGYTLDEDSACAWVRYLNDSMLSAVAGDHRFATLAGVPLHYPDAAVAEVRRARSAGHVGVIIGTAAPGVELDDPRLDPVWAELARTGMPVLVHPTFLARDPRLQAHALANAVGRAQETTVALSRLLLSGALVRHPGLRMIAAHGGGTLPFLLQRLHRAHELSPGTSPPAESFGRLFVDSVVLDPRVLAALLTFTGPSRVLLGSDYPFPWEPDPVGLIGSVPAGRREAAAMLGGNACELFGLGNRCGRRERRSAMTQHVRQPMTQPGEVGPAGDLPAEAVVAASRLVRLGRHYSLAVPRFRGMPLFPGHPAFEVLSFRTPRGITVAGEQPWGPGNDAQLGYMSELIMGTAHSGAHVDALAHMTIGPEARWYGGGNAGEHLGDFGPSYGDAAKLPAMFTRGILLDVAGWQGVPCLARGQPVPASDLAATARAQGVEVRPWDVVLIRTGYLSLWPDTEKMRAHLTPGPDISAAEWLRDRKIIATGTDTETYEVQPAPPGPPGQPSNPQPVHTKLLIEHGIYLMESIYLEELARDQVYEFLFVAAPLKITGATGSMIDPLAVI